MKLQGGTVWTPVVGWPEKVHPWMSAYCGYMALAIWQQFSGLRFALEYYAGRPAHALVHRGNIFYDARGELPHYNKEMSYEREIDMHLGFRDLLRSGLLHPKEGVRETTGALRAAQLWLQEQGIRSLDDFAR